MIHHTFQAMGTWVEAWVDGEGGRDVIEAWFETVEQACSRFRPDSELSQINRSSAARIAMSPTMSDVLEAACDIRGATGGLVDVGLGRVLSAWGYDRTYREVVDSEFGPGLVDNPSWRVDNRELIKSPGTNIDLGGIAKGWTCDRAVERGLAAVVSAGGDIRSADPRTAVPIMDPWGGQVATVSLGIGALATSSIAQRKWERAGREVNHIIDPRTLAPVRTPVLSATVVAETAVQAEAGAKSVVLRGEDGLVWADRTDWIYAALVVWHDGSVFATKSLARAA
jgi:thiamine biosynthesis lipoprotein